MNFRNQMLYLQTGVLYKVSYVVMEMAKAKHRSHWPSPGLTPSAAIKFFFLNDHTRVEVVSNLSASSVRMKSESFEPKKSQKIHLSS
jgi:hypothetical protein